MSAFGVALARALGPLGGPGVAGAMVAGGLALGALGGGLAVTLGGGGGSAAAGPSGRLPVYGCPGTGSPLAEVRAGQSVLATARTQDGTWLRIHLPLPGRTEGWVQAAPLQARSAVDALPVAECQPELVVLAPSTGPTATLTVPGSFEPPASEDVPPTPTPAATATPSAPPVANARPRLGNLTASRRTISYDRGGWCPSDPKRTTLSVHASDDTGIAGVQLLWRAPGSGGFSATAMTAVAGTRRNGTWQATLDTAANRLTTAGRLAWYVVATDSSGVTRRLPVEGTAGVTVKVCQNTGPTITQARSSSGSSLSWDPLGVGRCQTATNLTAAVKDVDGVKSVTLFYRKPGSSRYVSKAMDNTTIRGRWYANLDTLGDRISIVGPPTDNLSWYVRAVDDLGKASQTPARAITIRRCDTEADIGAPSSSSSLVCPSGPTWFYVSAADPDGIGGSSATFIYTYIRTDGSRRTIRKQMTGNNDGRWYYSVSIQAGSGWSLAREPMTFSFETRDRYGGTTDGGSGKATVTSC